MPTTKSYFKSASGAHRSPVNNCGRVESAAGTNSLGGEAGSHAEALLNEQHADVGRSDTATVRAIVARIKQDSPNVNRQQRSANPFKYREVAPSARLTEAKWARIPLIRHELAIKGIAPEKWQLEALTRGTLMKFRDESIKYEAIADWNDFFR